MWNKLGSPPENFRFYKYSEHSGDKNAHFKNINLDQNRTTLFLNQKDQNLSCVPEESLAPYNDEAISESTNKPLSSLKSTTKVNSRNINEKSAFDLHQKSIKHQNNKQSKSLLQNSLKLKSSVNLSQKNKSSSIIRQQGSKISSSSKKNKSGNNQKYGQQSFLNSMNNQQQEDSFSQIMIKQINKTQNSRKNKENTQTIEPNYLYEMVMTLRQIRDLSKQSLFTKKKLVKLLEDKHQISFLYDREEKSDIKHSKAKKPQRKSFKKPNQKSTIKKLGKSIQIQQRIAKVEQRLKIIQKKKQQDHFYRKTPTLSRTKKKSMSALR